VLELVVLIFYAYKDILTFPNRLDVHFLISKVIWRLWRQGWPKEVGLSQCFAVR